MNKILNKNFVEGGAMYCGRFKKDQSRNEHHGQEPADDRAADVGRLLFTPFGCSSNSIQPILSRLRREAGYYGKCHFIGRTPCSRVHDAV